MIDNLKVVAIIPARLDSNRLPGKALMTVGGIPCIRRVWLAAKGCKLIDQVVVAWSEKYADIPPEDVLTRVKRVIKETQADIMVRLTQDCPLLTTQDICEAFDNFTNNTNYYSNRRDGHDVQIIRTYLLWTDWHSDKEHVIKDRFITPSTGLSVDNKCQLERVRRIVSYAK